MNEQMSEVRDQQEESVTTELTEAAEDLTVNTAADTDAEESNADPHIGEAEALCELGMLTDPKRYSQLRAMGLSASEALRAAGPAKERDSRAHLVSGVPAGATAPKGGMSRWELETARVLFEGMDDTHINELYKKVTV